MLLEIERMITWIIKTNISILLERMFNKSIPRISEGPTKSEYKWNA